MRTGARIEVLCAYTILAAFLMMAIVSIYTTNSSTLFYLAFIVVSFVIGLAVSGWSSNHEAFFILLVSTLILRSIVPLSKPGMIIDNYPDAFTLRQNLLYMLNNHVALTPSAIVPDTDTTGMAYYFASYPGASLLLASLQMISGIDSNVLLKYLPILLILPVFGAIPIAVRALGIHSDRAELIATTIVVMIPFIMEGTSHDSPHSYGTIMFLIGIAFFLDWLTGRKRQSALCFTIVSWASVIYNVTSSVFLLAVILSLILPAALFRRRSQVKTELTLVLIFVAAIAGWSVYSSSAIVPFLYDVAVQIFSHNFASNLTPYLLPKTYVPKPLWIILSEYLAFGLFGVAALASVFMKAKGLFLAKLFTLTSALLALVFASVWLSGLQISTDMFERAFLLLMVGCAPLVGARLAKTIDELSNTLSKHGLLCQSKNFLMVALITLLVLNSVFYALPPYYYNASVPLQSEDTRYNLEKWQSLGVFFSSYADLNKYTFGPRLGQDLVGGYSGAKYTTFATSNVICCTIPASWFPYLPILERGNYIVISWSMLTAPDSPGYRPDILTPARISTRVYDNGEIILLVAFAPDVLVPSGNMMT